MSIQNETNALINAMIKLAYAIDEDHAAMCLDTGNTHPPAEDTPKVLVEELVALAFILNGSGLCEDGKVQRIQHEYRMR